MRDLIVSLQAEFLKGRGSAALWLSTLGPLLSVALFAYFGATQIDWSTREDPWDAFLNYAYAGVAPTLLPLLVIILCILVVQPEHRRRMWVQLDVLPLPYGAIYLGKFCYTLLLFIFAHLLFIAGTLLAGYILGIMGVETELLRQRPDPAYLLQMALRTVTGVLGLMGLHFWLSVQFRHFIIPLVIGILGYITAFTQLEQLDWSYVLPYAQPTEAVLYGLQPELDTVDWNGVPLAYYLSCVQCILLLLVGYLLTSAKKF